jgi:uncharacterized protein YecE (DUF72 family)
MTERRVVIPEADPDRLADATGLAERAPEPAVDGHVLFGTAGWTDKTLIQCGLFYPRGVTSPRARLSHYAHHFAVVEVDATYYTLLPPETAERWVDATPPTFRFDVKAHPILTGHPVDVTRLPADLKHALAQAGHTRRVYPDKMPPELFREMELRFRAMLEPLRVAGKLGSVFLQFPPWFQATRGNVQRIEVVAERWQGIPLAVEFRHKSWLLPERRERVLGLLRAHELSYVCVDEPDVKGGGVPPLLEVTRPALAIMRFHGHNVSGWQKRGASVHERFDYLYTSAELSAWVEPVRRLASEASEVHAVFNNCVRNYAVLNAKGLAALLTNAP